MNHNFTLGFQFLSTPLDIIRQVFVLNLIIFLIENVSLIDIPSEINNFFKRLICSTIIPIQY